MPFENPSQGPGSVLSRGTTGLCVPFLKLAPTPDKYLVALILVIATTLSPTRLKAQNDAIPPRAKAGASLVGVSILGFGSALVAGKLAHYNGCLTEYDDEFFCESLGKAERVDKSQVNWAWSVAALSSGIAIAGGTLLGMGMREMNRSRFSMGIEAGPRYALASLNWDF